MGGFEGLAAYLQQSAGAIGVVVDRGQATRLLEFAALVDEANRRFNLTAIREPRSFVVKHLVDSLAALRLGEVARAERIVDVGSGAGFPGIPLALAAAARQVLLVEAVRKKGEFLVDAAGRLGLDNVSVIVDRAESVGRHGRFRDRFQVGVARALADLPVLLEYVAPLVEPGGLVLAMKGPFGRAEAERSSEAARALACRIESIDSFELPEGAGGRCLIAVRKLGPTPSAFPRAVGVPLRRPLGAHGGR